ncbi:thioredoxin domain-containing protein [Altererythrobacter aerius]|uniref:Thioredoxin domain-containing protein n=1 Tax=Tsuneonella aeria TaxID=1837929 RepID=A0A6I4TAE1_9SPHN|nr:thioredoxin domain-containing protein [Tsuneonella aeria]
MKSATIAVAFAAALAATSAVSANTNWVTTVETAGGGHNIGNPAAKVKLTEFVSYTCPHCGTFARESSNPMEVYVATGKVRVDIRHVVRDPVDLTAAMLANCGPAIKFYRNHTALMNSQPRWLAAARSATSAQKSRWSNGPGSARRRAIASDLKLYDVMATRGYERIAIDRCLSDEALARRLAEQTASDDAKWNITSTPSFALDGLLLAGTSDWQTLRAQIDARM